jgi:hypothetical protein
VRFVMISGDGTGDTREKLQGRGTPGINYRDGGHPVKITGTGDTRYKLPGSGVPEGGPTPTILPMFLSLSLK